MTLSPSARDLAALIGVCLASLMFGLEISSIPVILPTLETQLRATFNDLQWIMNAYTIACTTVLMATGTLADRYGRKTVFVIATVAFGVTSLLCGLAESAPVLIVARFLQGMAGGAMFTCVIAIISHQFQDRRERSRAFSAWGVISGIGLGFGPIVGAQIVSLSDWPWVFLVHVPLTVLALIPAIVGIRESRDPNAGKLDLAGILTLTLAVFGSTFAITQAGSLSLPVMAALITATAISFAAFLLAEKTSAYPMFDFSVFRIRRFSGAIMGCIGMNFCYWPLIIYLPIYFKSGLGLDDNATGLLLLAYTLPFLMLPPVADHLLRRFGPRIAIPLGLATLGTGVILMRIGSGFENATWLTLLPGTLLAGIGLGLTNTPVTDTTTGSVPSDRAGMASGIDISARLISLAVNIAVMGLIFVEGIRWSLPQSLATALDGEQAQVLAAAIAAGNLDAVRQSHPGLAAQDPSGLLAHTALVEGFGWVMLYGGISAWLLAIASFAISGRGRSASASAPASAACAAE